MFSHSHDYCCESCCSFPLTRVGFPWHNLWPVIFSVFGNLFGYHNRDWRTVGSACFPVLLSGRGHSADQYLIGTRHVVSTACKGRALLCLLTSGSIKLKPGIMPGLTNKQTNKLPIDLIFGIEPRTEAEKMRPSFEKFVEEWQSSLKEAYDVVRRRAEKAADGGKRGYDKKVRGTDIDVGDRVLVRNREKGGTGKLRTHWENKIYVVVERNPNVPVYTLRPESGKQSIKRVHRNDILTCNFLLGQQQKNKSQKQSETDTAVDKNSESVSRGRKVSKSKKSKKNHKVRFSPTVAVKLESDSDSDEDLFVLREHQDVDDAVNDDTDVVGHNIEEENDFSGGEVVCESEYDEQDELSQEVSDDDLEDEDRTLPFEEGEELGEIEWNPNSLAEDELLSSESEPELSSDQSSTSDSDVETVRRSTRIRNAPQKFTYNEVGEPSYQIS